MNKIGYEQRVKVYADAIDTFGIDLQLTVAIEELSELQKEICKSIRGFTSTTGIAEEMADVQIVMEQLRFIFDNAECVDNYMDSKVKRLMGKIEDVKAAESWQLDQAVNVYE